MPAIEIQRKPSDKARRNNSINDGRSSLLPTTTTTSSTSPTATTGYQNLATYDGTFNRYDHQPLPTSTSSSPARTGTTTKNGSFHRLFNIIYDDNYEDDSSSESSDLYHPEYYMTNAAIEKMNNDTTLTDHDIMIIQRLACRKFHIPGQTFWEDYKYWFLNNHIFFSFCYADPRHPFGLHERIMNLISSLAFGLTATCCVVLWFHYHSNQRNFDRVLFSLFDMFNITNGMVALFIFSGPVHVIFDLGVFFLQACPPCRPGGFCESRLKMPEIHQTIWLWIGANLAFIITIASTSLAINVMLIRASVNEDDGNDKNISWDIRTYSFLLLYLLEVFMTHFVAFPLCTFTVFSGVLGCCGRLPGLGGRPYQVRKHTRLMERQRRLEQIQRQQQSQSRSQSKQQLNQGKGQPQSPAKSQQQQSQSRKGQPQQQQSPTDRRQRFQYFRMAEI